MNIKLMTEDGLYPERINAFLVASNLLLDDCRSEINRKVQKGMKPLETDKEVSILPI